jgi:hypothetical protein
VNAHNSIFPIKPKTLALFQGLPKKIPQTEGLMNRLIEHENLKKKEKTNP